MHINFKNIMNIMKIYQKLGGIIMHIVESFKNKGGVNMQTGIAIGIKFSTILIMIISYSACIVFIH